MPNDAQAASRGVDAAALREMRKSWEAETLLDGLDPSSIFGGSSDDEPDSSSTGDAKRRATFRVGIAHSSALSTACLGAAASWTIAVSNSSPSQDAEDGMKAVVCVHDPLRVVHVVQSQRLMKSIHVIGPRYSQSTKTISEHDRSTR